MSCNNEDTYESDEEFEYNYQICEEIVKNMQEVIASSENPWLLQCCHPTDLMGFIDSRDHQLPEYLQEKKSEEKLFIPEPITSLDWELATTTDIWVMLKSESEKLAEQKLKREQTEVMRIKKEQEVKELAEKKALEAQIAANKYNWTIPKPKKPTPPPTPVQEKPKRRRNRRRGGFKVRKTTVKYNPNEQQPIQQPRRQQKSKGKFQVRRTVVRYQ